MVSVWGVRASEADPRRSGVDAAISVPGVPEKVPPGYVLWDVDASEHGVRRRVMAAVHRSANLRVVVVAAW
jgi:hypothetical protein